MTRFVDRFQKIPMQTKSQGLVIDFLNKLYDNYGKKCQERQNKTSFFQHPLFPGTKQFICFGLRYGFWLAFLLVLNILHFL